MSKIKVLIADDYKAIADMEKNYIEKESNIFDVIDIATNSKEETEMIDKYNPNLVITDIVRKGEDISGFDIVLKCLKENKNTNFILITASTENEILFEYKCNEMPKNIIGFLKKPFNWDSFTKKIEIMVLRLSNHDLKEDYYNNRYIKLLEELSNKDIEVLNKLDIIIENKNYSRYEYDIVKQKFGMYFNEREDELEVKKIKKSLKKKNVSCEEYNNVLNTFDKIDNKYIYN